MAIPPRHLHADPKQILQSLNLQDIFFGSVRDDPPAAHQHDALNFWNDIGEFVRDQDEGCACLRQ